MGRPVAPFSTLVWQSLSPSLPLPIPSRFPTSTTQKHSSSPASFSKRFASQCLVAVMVTVGAWQQLPRRRRQPLPQPNFALNRATGLLSERKAESNDAPFSAQIRLWDGIHLPEQRLPSGGAYRLAVARLPNRCREGHNSIKVSRRKSGYFIVALALLKRPAPGCYCYTGCVTQQITSETFRSTESVLILGLLYFTVLQLLMTMAP